MSLFLEILIDMLTWKGKTHRDSTLNKKLRQLSSRRNSLPQRKACIVDIQYQVVRSVIIYIQMMSNGYNKYP